MDLLKIWHLFLCLFKLGKCDEELFVHVVFAKELDCSLVDASRAVDVAVLLLETRVLDPIAHFRVDDHKCTKVKVNISNSNSPSTTLSTN